MADAPPRVAVFGSARLRPGDPGYAEAPAPGRADRARRLDRLHGGDDGAIQTGDVGPRPLVAVGPRWRALLPQLRARLVLDDRDLALVRVVDDAEAAVAVLAEALPSP